MCPSEPSADASVDVVAPDLGLDPGERPVISCWLVRAGETVVEGDRLVEILADLLTFDIPSPATGRLVRILAETDEPIDVGQVLATIAVAGSAEEM